MLKRYILFLVIFLVCISGVANGNSANILSFWGWPNVFRNSGQVVLIGGEQGDTCTIKQQGMTKVQEMNKKRMICDGKTWQLPEVVVSE